MMTSLTPETDSRPTPRRSAVSHCVKIWIDQFSSLRLASGELRRSPYRTPFLLGLGGSIAIALASLSSGAIMYHDPWVNNLDALWTQNGHAQSGATIALWTGIIALIVAWIIIGGNLFQTRIDSALKLSSKATALIPLLWSIPLLFAAPLFSRDAYSYLAQGKLKQTGIDAYSFGINSLTQSISDPYFIEVSPEWRNTTTPYGPLHLEIMSFVTRVSGNNIHIGLFVLKMLSILTIFALALATIRLAQSLGTDPSIAVWLGVMNPLAIVHLVGGMHNENIMLFFMVAGLALVIKKKPLMGIVLITLALSVKATAGIALPFAISIWMYNLRNTSSESRESWKVLIPRFFKITVVGSFVSLLTFTALSFVTQSGFGWFWALSGSSKVINWLSVPTLLAHVIGEDQFSLTLSVLRRLFTIIMVCCIIGAWFYFRKTPKDAIIGIIVSFIAITLFNSLALPWYYLWFIVLVGCIGLSSKWITVYVIFSVWATIITSPSGAINIYSISLMAFSLIVTLSAYCLWHYVTASPKATTSPKESTSTIG